MYTTAYGKPAQNKVLRIEVQGHARLERPCMRPLRYAEECFAHRVNELDA